MKTLSGVLQQVKSSASVYVQLLEKDLKNVKENLDKTITYLKTRISTNNIQKAKAVEEIRHMRKSIDDLLTNVEQNLHNDLECKHSELNSEIVNLVQQMEQQASKINQMQSEYTKLTQYPTDLQMYFGMKEIEKATSQSAKYIDDLERDDHFYEKNIQVRISSELQSILQDVNSFGDIQINTSPSTLQLKAGRKDQTQHLVKNIPEIEQIKPSLLRTLISPNDMSSVEIRACVALPDGHIYGTIWQESKVSCYKSTGELLWTFKHDDIEIPQGISLDKNGFVYKPSSGNDSIVVVSPDGKVCKTILSSENGINEPWAIDIHRETRIMIVSNKIRNGLRARDSAFVYKI
ncbi:unnamed protein product [Mytilus edulis]|uniref:Uncharacterized protein n=1 Tax=Mytilus edulis TaxID=6550 RepID=A0A8S3VD19_MYTED|nr:unnamed protein product [Mytilus edulis]